jgi:hypothetical protein
VIRAHHPRRVPSFCGREVVCYSKPSNAQFASRMHVRDLQTFQRSNAPLSPCSPIPLSLLECALADKHRVLPAFSRNRRPATSLECALPRVLLHKLFRMRSSEKTGGRVFPTLWILQIFPLPFSVYSSKFRIPQALCLPLLRKHRGCGGILPILELGWIGPVNRCRRGARNHLLGQGAGLLLPGRGHWFFSPARELPSALAAADADSASQCSNGCCRTASRCKLPALRYRRYPPAPFRPCEFPAETL